MQTFFDATDTATRAFVTSNGVSRWTAFRIDMQAYYFATIFAASALFGTAPETTTELAVQAVAF